MSLRSRALSLRALVVGGLFLALSLALVPARRITNDLVAIAAERADRTALESAAALAARSLDAGVSPELLVGPGISCLCVGASCMHSCTDSESSRRACARTHAGQEICVIGSRNALPDGAMRLAEALLVLVAVVVFAVSTLLLTLFVVRPLRTLASEAARREDGRTPLRSVPSPVLEIQALERALTEMIARLAAREAEVAERLAATEAANAALVHANQELAATREQLLQTERLAAVGRLSAGLAHEIGNPLTAILALLDLLLAGDLPPTQQVDFLERIRAENERIAAIVRSLVDFSRPDTPGTPPTASSSSPVAVAEDLVRFFAPQKRYRHARIGVVGGLGIREVRMHEGALRQVLLNLVLNAADALEGREPPGVVLIGFEDAGDAVRILVEDDGPGVDPAIGDRLFEPFVTGKVERGGTGLGLSICRGLVEAAGGRLELVRSDRSGTRFALTLLAAD